MKIDRIKLSMEFNVLGLGQWLTAECPVAPEEDAVEEYQKVKSIIQEAINKFYPNKSTTPEFIPEVQVGKTKQSSSQRIIEQINQCSDKTVLESFKLLAKSNPEIQKAYDNKLGQF